MSAFVKIISINGLKEGLICAVCIQYSYSYENALYHLLPIVLSLHTTCVLSKGKTVHKNSDWVF